MGSHFGVGEFTTYLASILVVGLGCEPLGRRALDFEPWPFVFHGLLFFSHFFFFFFKCRLGSCCLMVSPSFGFCSQDVCQFCA